MMRLRYKIFVTVIILCAMHGIAHAQQVMDIRGVVFKKGSPERVSQTLVTNMKTNAAIVSNDVGGFSIKASAGDTLLFTAYNYTPQKIAVVNAYELAINLQPVIELGGVV